VLRSQRTVKKTGQTTLESRYYLSNVPAQDYAPGQWLDLIRGHWGGVEVRNHWRRDAVMGEDGPRSRQPRLLANLALIRNVLLQLLSDALQEQSLPQLHERLHSHPPDVWPFSHAHELKTKDPAHASHQPPSVNSS
jgi:predicted transposase YbfD/YdcC